MEATTCPASAAVATVDAQSGVSWPAVAAGTVAARVDTAAHCIRSRDRLFIDIAVERHRRLGVHVRGRDRHLSGDCRRDVVSRGRPSRRPVANQMDRNSQQRGVLSRHRARVAGLEFRDPAQRDDLDREHCVSRKRRGGGGRPLGQAARSINPAQLYVDKLFRPATGTTASVSAAAPNTPTSARSGFADDSTIKREALLQGQR